MGAHHVLDYRQPLDTELARIGVPTVDYVASLTASAHYLPLFATIVAPQGHIALIDDPKTFDIVPLKTKAITVAWELMFTRSMFHTPDMIEQHRLLDRVSQLVDLGVVRSTVTKVFSPINAAILRKAHAQVESGRSIGKSVVVNWRI